MTKKKQLLNKFDDISIAKSVLSIEIEGLQALEAWLDQPFIKAVDLIYNAKGRVVLSGMGKSGHIARKIAATLSSTGTPALFVHPGEASHGDLGMITKDDVVVLLSNSGETAELKDIIYFSKRFSIPLIGIVRRSTSVLVTFADVALILPGVKEACQVNAPTTSTTMMLALGDALAVSVAERRGFNNEDFGVYHPGGKLGTSFLKVENLMHTDKSVPKVYENTLIPQAVNEMTDKKFGCTAVLDKNDKVVGIITDGDLRRHLAKDLTNYQASEIMTKNPQTISKKSLATQALAIMQQKAITSLLIVEDDQLVGIIHIHDILKSGVA